MPIAANNTVNTLLQMSQQAAQRRDNLHGAYMQGQQATNQMQMGLLQAMVQNEQFQQSLGQRESEFSRDFGQRGEHFDRRIGEEQRQFDTSFGEGVRQFDKSLSEEERQFTLSHGQRIREHTDHHGINLGNLALNRATTAMNIRQTSLDNVTTFINQIQASEDNNEKRRIVANRWGVDPGPDADIMSFIQPYLEQDMMMALSPLQAIGGGIGGMLGSVPEDQRMDMGGMLQQAFPTMSRPQDQGQRQGPVQPTVQPQVGGGPITRQGADQEFTLGGGPTQGIDGMLAYEPQRSQPAPGGLVGLLFGARDMGMRIIGQHDRIQNNIMDNLQSGTPENINNREFIHQMKKLRKGDASMGARLIGQAIFGSEHMDHRKQTGGLIAEDMTRLKVDLDRQRFIEEGMDPSEAHEKAVQGSVETQFRRYHIASDRLNNIQQLTRDLGIDIDRGQVDAALVDQLEQMGLRTQISTTLDRIRTDLMSGNITAYTDAERQNLITLYNQLASVFHDRETPYTPLNIKTGRPVVSGAAMSTGDFSGASD